MALKVQVASFSKRSTTDSVSSGPARAYAKPILTKAAV